MSKLPANEIKTNRKRVQVVFTQPSLTKQEFQLESDINEIIRKFKVTGELPQRQAGIYADTTQIPDFQTLMDTITQAEDMFMSYPAELRARFNNDPSQMLDWATKPENESAAISLGILQSKNMPVDVPKQVPPASTEKQENLTKPPEK